MVRNHIGNIDELMQVEAWFGTDDPVELVKRYNAALLALEDTDFETWLASAALAGVSTESGDRFRADWISGTRLPGVDPDVFQSRLREGFTDALTSARDAVRKLSIIFSLEGGGDFEVDHCVGTNACTVVIFVPIDTTIPKDPAAS